jgi:hypothetical protein
MAIPNSIGTAQSSCKFEKLPQMVSMRAIEVRLGYFANDNFVGAALTSVI